MRSLKGRVTARHGNYITYILETIFVSLTIYPILFSANIFNFLNGKAITGIALSVFLSSVESGVVEVLARLLLVVFHKIYYFNNFLRVRIFNVLWKVHGCYAREVWEAGGHALVWSRYLHFSDRETTQRTLEGSPSAASQPQRISAATTFKDM